MYIDISTRPAPHTPGYDMLSTRNDREEYQ